jgi:hypothetical protein
MEVFPSTQRSSIMEIKRSGAEPSGKGSADWFTGAVRVDPLFSPPEPARVAGALVTFEPGAPRNFGDIAPHLAEIADKVPPTYKSR